MSIFEKLFKKDKQGQVQKQPVGCTPAARTPEKPAPIPVSKTSGSNFADYVEQCLKTAQDKMPNERIAYYFSIKDSIDSSWTEHQKAHLYYWAARSAEAGFADAKYRESNLSLAFYAAQLFFEPDFKSYGWAVFDRYGFKASKENAIRLHEAYPLPESLEAAQNYNVAAIRCGTDDSEKKKNSNIRHIVCLCYDAPYINSLKPQMQNFIIKAEQNRGSVITPTSRITFDSFYDNSSLEKQDMILQKLAQVYSQVYNIAEINKLAEQSVAREVQQKDGHTLVKYFVLYE